jgi:hypothetical protein
LAPGLIDTGIAWIGEILKDAGDRKIIPHYAAAAISAGPSYQLPTCLQLVYGTFDLSGSTPPISNPAGVDPQQWNQLKAQGLLNTVDGQPPHLWLEVEVHYFPQSRTINGAYQPPTAYALVPTRLNWNRSTVSGKPMSPRDLLVFINVAAPASAANEATTGFSKDPSSVARLSWYHLPAGKPAIDTVFAGRTPFATPARVASQGTNDGTADAIQPEVDEPINARLPPTASAWAPFPSTDKDQPVVFWANITEARDGIKALKKLGEALAARKSEVSTALGTSLIPSQRDAAELTRNTAEITDYKTYLTAVTASYQQSESFKQACLKYAAAAVGTDAAAISQALVAARTEGSKWLEQMYTAKQAGLKLEPIQQPYPDSTMQQLQTNLAGAKVCAAL